MAKQAEETVLVKIQLDGEENLTKQEQYRKSLTALVTERNELNKAFKAGHLTADEHAKDLTRINNLTKITNDLHNKEQQAITGVKSQTDKLIASNKQLESTVKKTGESFKDATNNIRIAGVSVGDITTKIASFANPATAIVGIVSALAGAYARSTIGAKDLEFAQNQLSSAFTISTNAFAKFISSTEDGQGIISRVTDFLIGGTLGLDTLVLSKLSALNQERLEDLGRTELQIRDTVNERLEENFNLLSDINAEGAKFVDQQFYAGQIIDNLRKNEEELVDIKTQQLEIIKSQLAIDQENEGLQTAVLEKEREISNIQRDAEKKVQLVVRQLDNLNTAENKRLSILYQQAEAEKKVREARDGRADVEGVSQIDKNSKDVEDLIKANELKLQSTNKFAAAQASIQKSIDEGIKKSADFKVEASEVSNKLVLDSAQELSQQLNLLANEGIAAQKALTLAQLGIDTASAIGGLTANAERNPAGAITFGLANILHFAAGLVRIFANIGAAKKLLGFFDGGIIPGYAGGGLSGTRIMSHHGRAIQRSNGDDRLATVKVGEVILNEHQQAALGGHSTFSRIGVPGFATGGLTSEITRSASQSAIASQNSFDAIINGMSRLNLVVYADDISAKQKVNSRTQQKAQVL